jgi:hypothetical protein
LNEVARGNAEITGIAGDRIFSELRIGNDERRKRHEVQADPMASIRYVSAYGEPARAAPLEIRMTEAPHGRSRDSTALQK